MRKRIKVAALAAAMGAAALALGGCGDPTQKPDIQLTRLPDNSLHVVVSETNGGIMMTSREATAYHCVPHKCVPVPMFGSTGPGVVPVIANLGSRLGGAGIMGNAIEHGGSTSTLEIQNGSTNLNANLNRLKQLSRQNVKQTTSK